MRLRTSKSCKHIEAIDNSNGMVDVAKVLSEDRRQGHNYVKYKNEKQSINATIALLKKQF